MFADATVHAHQILGQETRLTGAVCGIEDEATAHKKDHATLPKNGEETGVDGGGCQDHAGFEPSGARTEDTILDREASRTLEELKIEALDESEVGTVLGVLERGMRDNPIHAAAFGNDPKLRRSRLRRVFGAGLEGLGLHRHMLVARRSDGSIVGVCGARPPGECRPGLGKQLRLAPHVLALGPPTAVRTAHWMEA